MYENQQIVVEKTIFGQMKNVTMLRTNKHGFIRQTMGLNRAVATQKEKARWTRAATARQPKSVERRIVGMPHRSTLEGYTFPLSAVSNLSSVFSTMESRRGLGQDITNIGRRFKQAWED